MIFFCVLVSLAQYHEPLLIGYPSFYYFSSNMFNSEVLNGCEPEKISILW